MIFDNGHNVMESLKKKDEYVSYAIAHITHYPQSEHNIREILSMDIPDDIKCKCLKKSLITFDEDKQYSFLKNKAYKKMLCNSIDMELLPPEIYFSKFMYKYVDKTYENDMFKALVTSDWIDINTLAAAVQTRIAKFCIQHNDITKVYQTFCMMYSHNGASVNATNILFNYIKDKITIDEIVSADNYARISILADYKVAHNLDEITAYIDNNRNSSDKLLYLSRIFCNSLPDNVQYNIIDYIYGAIKSVYDDNGLRNMQRLCYSFPGKEKYIINKINDYKTAREILHDIKE